MQKETRDEITKGFAEELRRWSETFWKASCGKKGRSILGSTQLRRTATTPGTSSPSPAHLRTLEFPASGKGISNPKIPSYRKRASLEPSEAILTLYAVGVSTRNISRFLEGVYGAFYSPQSVSRLLAVAEEQVRLSGKAPSGGVLRGVSRWDFPSHPPWKNGQGTGVHGPGDQVEWALGDPRVLAVWGGRGKRQELGGGTQRPETTGDPNGANLHYR